MTKMEYLLDLMPSLGSKAFQKFCTALDQSGQESIVDVLLCKTFNMIMFNTILKAIVLNKYKWLVKVVRNVFILN